MPFLSIFIFYVCKGMVCFIVEDGRQREQREVWEKPPETEELQEYYLKPGMAWQPVTSAAGSPTGHWSQSPSPGLVQEQRKMADTTSLPLVIYPHRGASKHCGLQLLVS